MKVITIDEFDKLFTEVKNCLNQPSFENFDFEAYEDSNYFENTVVDIAYINKLPINHIWTYLEENDKCIYVSGIHSVNRLAYIVTVQPWLEETIVTH